MHKKTLFFFLTLLIPLVFTNAVASAPQPTEKIICLSILLDTTNSESLNALIAFMRDTGIRYTIVADIPTLQGIQPSIIQNMSNYAEFAPIFGFLQCYTPVERSNKIDYDFEAFKQIFGKYPDGMFMFQPDTYSINYAKEKYGIKYVQGYCFDQYVIDWMTMRGGWQLPYYASKENAMIPSTTTGVIVLPHFIGDYIHTFTKDHQYGTHPLSAISMMGGIENGKRYWVNLMEESLSCSTPFGYATAQFEWDWACHSRGYDSVYADWFNSLKNKGYSFKTFSEFSDWFLSNYEKNPTYSVKFTSPLDGASIEWYWCTSYRVARIGSEVVSYVDYTNQSSDRYLATRANVNFSNPASATNCIDTSLKFTIDDLGGAPNRAPPQGNSIAYRGSLAAFKSYFNSVQISVSMKDIVYSFVPILIVIGVMMVCVRLLTQR